MARTRIVYLSDEIDEMLKDANNREGKSMSGLIASLLWKHFEKIKAEKTPMTIEEIDKQIAIKKAKLAYEKEVERLENDNP